MPVKLKDIDESLRKLLKPDEFSDYCPNGIQIEGKDEIKKIISGVTACRSLIEAAIDKNADLILVHHGYFWKGEKETITGLKKARIQLLLRHDISLCAYHLPLDAHPELGNNAQLAKPQSFENFQKFLTTKLKQKPLSIEGCSKEIKLVAWCSGAAQEFIALAAESGVDAYITGEVSEQTVHIARETGLHFFAAGHHATERFGVQALGKYLAKKYSISHTFIDIPNPV